MTTHDQAFFTADGDALVPNPIARGPWGSTISGTYVGGLLGRAIERAGGDPDLQPARLTVDLLRPAALERRCGSTPPSSARVGAFGWWTPR